MPRESHRLWQTFGARINAIRQDNRSGSSALVREALAILTDAQREGEAALKAVAPALCAAQPSMAGIWNGAAIALGDRGSDTLARFAERVRRAPDALARFGIQVLLAGGPPTRALTVATVSASHSVAVCLEAVAQRGTLSVRCAEGRPVYEGREFAAALAARGIGVELYTDAAIGTALEQVDVVLVGADAVSPRWFINKCGTWQLAAVAAEHGIPLYVVASRDKFLGPPLDARLRLGHGPAAEVWAGAPAIVKVSNPYFERVPIDAVASLITDGGAVGPGSAAAVCAGVNASAAADRLSALLDEPLDPRVDPQA